MYYYINVYHKFVLCNRHSDWRKTEKRKRQTVLQCVGEPEDDVYWCVKCIRAIMNSGIGFPKVYNNQRCLKNITQCLMHNNHRYVITH